MKGFTADVKVVHDVWLKEEEDAQLGASSSSAQVVSEHVKDVAKQNLVVARRKAADALKAERVANTILAPR